MQERANPSSARLATSAKREVPRAPCNKREVPRAGFARVSYHTQQRKHYTVYPHKELQSAFTSFISSGRMRYESLPHG